MIIGLAGVSTALIMGGLAFFGALTYSVDRTLDNETLASAEEVGQMINDSRLPSPIPISGAQVVQVVDAQQRVIGGSVTADRLTPLLRPDELARALTGQAVIVDGVRLGISGPLRVRAIQAGPAAAPVSIMVGLPFGDVLTRLGTRPPIISHRAPWRTSHETSYPRARTRRCLTGGVRPERPAGHRRHP